VLIHSTPGPDPRARRPEYETCNTGNACAWRLQTELAKMIKGGFMPRGGAITAVASPEVVANA
jgi:hypothetical protein